MKNLTNETCLLMYEVTEWHLAWYELYYENPPKFSTLLEINYIKLQSCSCDFWKDEDYYNKLIEFKYQYIDMYDEELNSKSFIKSDE